MKPWVCVCLVLQPLSASFTAAPIIPYMYLIHYTLHVPYTLYSIVIHYIALRPAVQQVFCQVLVSYENLVFWDLKRQDDKSDDNWSPPCFQDTKYCIEDGNCLDLIQWCDKTVFKVRRDIIIIIIIAYKKVWGYVTVTMLHLYTSRYPQNVARNENLDISAFIYSHISEMIAMLSNICNLFLKILLYNW